MPKAAIPGAVKPLLGMALLAAGVAYPFWVHAMMDKGKPAWLLLPVALLWLARALTSRTGQAGGRLLPLLALLGCMALALSGSQQGLRWYPVLIDALFLAVFAGSLRHGPPVVERLARLRHPDLPPAGIRYTRRVTQVWVGYFLCNGLLAAALSLWAPWSWWSAYNGFICYVLMGLLFAIEWLIRPRAYA